MIWLSILLISEKARRASFLKHREHQNTEFIYKKIFGTAPDSVLVYNDQGNLMYTSPLAKKTFGDNLQNLEKIRAFEWRGPSEINRFKRSQSLFLTGKRTTSASARKTSVSSPHIMATVGNIMDIVKLFKQTMIEDNGNALYECKYTEETRNRENPKPQTPNPKPQTPNPLQQVRPKIKAAKIRVTKISDKSGRKKHRKVLRDKLTEEGAGKWRPQNL